MSWQVAIKWDATCHCRTQAEQAAPLKVTAAATSELEQHLCVLSCWLSYNGLNAVMKDGAGTTVVRGVYMFAVPKQSQQEDMYLCTV